MVSCKIVKISIKKSTNCNATFSVIKHYKHWLSSTLASFDDNDEIKICIYSSM